MTGSDPTSPHVGMMIAGRYRLDEHYKSGGMADVWKATDTQLNRVVAVKLLKAKLANEQTTAERFRREAEAAANINSAFIVTVFDAVLDRGRQAVIMEFVKGDSLRELLDARGRLEQGEVIRIAKCVCSALEAAHQTGIIHRDVKPGNVLLIEGSKNVKLTDFGIAKALDGDDLTSENIMMGTAKYLAPEQVRGEPLDGRADIYSLGLMLYECLAGKVPFVGASDTETALARLNKRPEMLTRVRPDIEPEFAAVIHTMLERKPEHRYASAAEALRALNGVGKGSGATTTISRDPTPSGKVIRTPGGTPSGSQRPRNTPSRATRPTTTGWKPTPKLIIGAVVGLLILGVIIAKTSGGSNGTSPETTVAPAAPTTLFTGPLSITGVKSYDPEGDDGEENDGDVAKITDGDPSTAWTTSCYKSSTFGSKSGVGVVVQLNAAALAQISVDMAESGWSARVYAADEVGKSVSDWGSPIWEGGSDAGEGITATFKQPARYALVFFTEIGRSGFCSNKNPFRGSISDVRAILAP